MRVRNVDSNGDWTFGQSQQNYVRDALAVASDIKMRLQEWYGDCFFALQRGIPWDVRLGGLNQKDALDRDIIEITQNVEGVLGVLNFESMAIDRRYRCSFEVYTKYSTEILPITFDTKQGVVQ